MKLITLTVLPLWAWILSLILQGTLGQSSLKTFSPDLQFDNYTLILKGQRIFLHSGEFHTFRLPVPSLWPDILDKFKAAGFNAISVYVHMGLVNPSPGVMDFDGYRSLSALYEAARLAGLWIVLRPDFGQYINGETTAGGLPHWVTSQVKSELRTTAADWNAAWTPYIQAIIGQTNQSQISNGGPVIAIQIAMLDNEYDQEEGGPYFAEIEALYRDPSSGIEVPLTHNDPGMLDAFINGTSMDAYPQGLVASNLSIWNPIEMGYHTYHEEANPSQPWYSPEFQSGAFDGWGPDATGYEDWRAVTDADFVSVFYLHTWASNAKLVNYYMLYGGTSWGALPYPYVYTSYDYGAAITEARTLTRKYTELKLQGIFLRSSPEFYKTDWIGTSSSNLTEGAIIPSSPPTSPAFVTLLRNLDTGAGFWIVRQNDSTSLASSSFKLHVTTAGNQKLTIPIVASSINLDGRKSKVIATDYAFGSRSRTLYSTALIFFSGSIDGIDVLFLYGDSDQEHEVALNLTGSANRTVQDHTHVQITSDDIHSTTIITVKSGFQGFIPLYESDTQLILFADKDTVSDFWAPTVASDNLTDPFANYWSIGTNETVLVGGPYLVRSAVISGTELALEGDLNATNTEQMPLTVIASSTIKSLTWNGENVSLELTTNESMIRTGKLSSTKISIQVPDLEALEWKFNNSLPEVHTNFDDSDWAIANHTTTNIPFPMYYGDGRILYGCDYGFCENVVLWRGHFNASGSEKSVNLSINGGAAFAASVWLNDRFLNTSFGNSTNNANVIEETDEIFDLPTDALLTGQDNVITVVQDNMGINEAKQSEAINDDAKSPRGIRGFQLNTGNFTEWRVQGKVGGYVNYRDKVRGVLNEGGLFGERHGWHLPGFDTSSWASRKLSTGNPSSEAGIGFFVASFNLSMPQGYDIPMSFTFSEPLGQPYRAYMFINGWMMGKRVANLGPQSKFPVHEGILNYHGKNTVAVALWSMTPNATVALQLQLVIDGIFKGGVNVAVNNPSWSSELIEGR
ncbi:glycoside hydrolase family 35 protein [Lentinula edodes]|nr:glycoside hydrolase family 35 protein [Lentinula edodes]